MDHDQPKTNQDGPIKEPTYTDQNVEHLYQNGHISRAEADVYDIIATFNDGQGGIPCQAS